MEHEQRAGQLGLAERVEGLVRIDRATGGLLPALLTFVLSAVGIGWQSKNIAAWVRSQPLYGGISGTSVKDQSAPW